MNLSRRSLFKAAAGCALLPPAVSASSETVASQAIDVQPSLQAQFERYSNLMADVIRKMHPGVTDIVGPTLTTREDGSFVFVMGGIPAYQDFSGDGLYDLTEFGAPATYFVEEHSYPTPRTGSYFLCYPAFNGRIHWDDAPRPRDRILILRRHPEEELARLLEGRPRCG